MFIELQLHINCEKFIEQINVITKVFILNMSTSDINGLSTCSGLVSIGIRINITRPMKVTDPAAATTT